MSESGIMEHWQSVINNSRKHIGGMLQDHHASEGGHRPFPKHLDAICSLDISAQEMYDRIQYLTAEVERLQKIIDGPDEETIVAYSMDKDKPAFTLTPDAMREMMDKWAEQDAYPQTYTFTMTEGIWYAMQFVFTQRNQALAEVERLREGLELAHTVAHASPELNPSNYDHDQVCELNTTMCEVFGILNELNKEAADGK